MGQFGLYASRNLASMVYPVLPEDAVIRVSAIRPTELLINWPEVLDADKTNIEYCVLVTEGTQWRQRVVTNACDLIWDTKRKLDPTLEAFPDRKQVCTRDTHMAKQQLKPATAYFVEVEARNTVTGRYVPYIATRAVTSAKGLPLLDSQELAGTSIDGYSKKVFTFDIANREDELGPLSLTVSSCSALHGWLLTRDGIHVSTRSPEIDLADPSTAAAAMMAAETRHFGNQAILQALNLGDNFTFSEPRFQQSTHESANAERGVYQLTVFNHGPKPLLVDVFATTSPSKKPFPTIPRESDVLVHNLSCDSAILNWHEGLGATNITYCLQLTVGYEQPLLSDSLNRCHAESSYSVVVDMLKGSNCSSETQRAVALATRNASNPITAEVVAVNTYTRRVVVYPPSTFSCKTSLNAALVSSASSLWYSLALNLVSAGLVVLLAMDA